MIICICGPTGVGKTKLSIELAKKYNAIVLNCDAMQVYKGMDIGTAKIKEEEKENVKHYLFDIRNVKKENNDFTFFSVAFLEGEKGFDTLIKSFAKVYKNKNVIIQVENGC